MGAFLKVICRICPWILIVYSICFIAGDKDVIKCEEGCHSAVNKGQRSEKEDFYSFQHRFYFFCPVTKNYKFIKDNVSQGCCC